MSTYLETSTPTRTSSVDAYNLAELLDQIMHTEDPEVEQMLDNAIEDAKEGFKDYVTQAISNSKHLDQTVEAIDLEIRRLQELKHARTAKAERLRNAVKRYCEMLGITEIVTDLYTIKWRKNPASVVIENEATLILSYPEFVNEKIVRSINKRMIADRLKAGQEVNGAALHYGSRIVIE